jgi:hypothetical protein
LDFGHTETRNSEWDDKRNARVERTRDGGGDDEEVLGCETETMTE